MGTDIPAAGGVGFGERLLRLRSDAGLSQEDLAHAAGVSVRAVSDMERGRSRGPQRRTVAALASALALDATATQELERAASLGRPRTRRTTSPTTAQPQEPDTGQSAPSAGAGGAGGDGLRVVEVRGDGARGDGARVGGACADGARGDGACGHGDGACADPAHADGARGDGACTDAAHADGPYADGARGDGTCEDGACADTARGDGNCTDAPRADGACTDGAHADGARGDGARGDGARGDGARGDGACADGAHADDAPAAGTRTHSRPTREPREHPLALPRDLHDFTARGPALARLTALAAYPDPAHPPVAVISGQPGLGKTAFAVHAAHRLAPHFPDGQFALDLRGMDPRPTLPRDALARLLRALGVADSAVPAATEDRSGLLRSVLRDRRVLLLLDNAVDEDQVSPMLPGQGASLTLVTSRQALAGLVSVHRTELALLRREEAVELLTRIIGAERVGQEAQAARDLAELCGHLPLAVRIAGQRLAARPGERIAKLVTQLTEQGDRLDTLRAGSLEVRAAFALSYRRLSPQTRTVFRRSCLAAGPDFSPETAALLAGLTRRQAARCAQDLADAGLLQPHPGADRYGYHDLLALYAAEQLAEEDDPREIAAAEDRAARWTLRRATAAALHFDADRGTATPGAPDGDPDPATAPTGPGQAHAWLESERAQWLEALRRSQIRGEHQQVIDTAEAMHWFSDRTLHWEVWAEVFQRAVDSARALGSRRDEAVHLNYLSWAYNMCLYDHPAALTTARAALEAAREVGDELQVGWALGYAAGALRRLGRTEEAIEQLREAADHLASQTCAPSRLAELTSLNVLGELLCQEGRAAQALAIHRRSEAVCRAGVPGKSPELVGLYLASVRQHIGNDLAALGRWTEAEAPLRYALGHFEVARMPAWSEPARLELGIVLRHLARHDEAHAALTAAHDALARLNSPRRLEAAAELRTLAAAQDTTAP